MNMKKSTIVILTLLLIAGICISGESNASIRIDINSPGITQFPISVAPFKALGGSGEEGKIAKELNRLMGKNLEFTGYFKIVSPNLSFENPDQMGLTKDSIQFKSWSVLGVELLITGGIRIDAGTLFVELRLFEVSEERMAVGKRYTGEFETGPKMINKFSNEILNYLIGFKGYFQSKIAFVAGDHKSKDIYYMDFNGQNIKRVTNYNSITITPEWSPSGNQVVFTSFKDGQPDLFMLDLRSMVTSKISSRKGLNIAPSWSPTGDKIALTLSKDGEENIFLIDTKGKIIRQLTKMWGINVSPTWSSDGNHIAFVSNRSGNAQIYVKNVVTEEEERLTLEGKRNLDPSWSPRGDRIAFAGATETGTEIFTIRTDGSELQQLTFTGGLNLSPTWSPDGSMIAFSSDRDGEKTIFVMNSNGANQRRLTFLQGTQESPSWSVNLP